MSVYFTSDPHLGHRNILKYRDFPSIEAHDQVFFSQLYSLRKRDVVKILGDVVIKGCEPHIYEYYVQRLLDAPCRVQIMLGNHDHPYLHKAGLEILRGLEKYKEFWLSHCPIHPNELRGRINIHGHMHKEVLDDPRYLNVNMDVCNYRFMNLDEIRRLYA